MENSTNVFNVTSEVTDQENDDVRVQATSFLMYKIGKFYIGYISCIITLHHIRPLRCFVGTNTLSKY